MKKNLINTLCVCTQVCVHGYFHLQGNGGLHLSNSTVVSKNQRTLVFLLFYKCSKIILIINFFHNSRMYLQNGVKKQNVQNSFICQGNTVSSQQGSTYVQLILGYKHISSGTTAFKANINLSEIELYIKWLHYQNLVTILDL